MPSSMRLLTNHGAGNRVSEQHIVRYLRDCLGEAPQPTWGCPEGWGSYLATLFSWVLDRTVSRDDAITCAKRRPGCSWEVDNERLVHLGECCRRTLRAAGGSRRQRNAVCALRI